MGLAPDDSGDFYLCSQAAYASGPPRCPPILMRRSNVLLLMCCECAADVPLAWLECATRPLPRREICFKQPPHIAWVLQAATAHCLSPRADRFINTRLRFALRSALVSDHEIALTSMANALPVC